MYLNQLLEVLDKETVIDLEIDGDFYLSEKGTKKHINKEVESLNGNTSRYTVDLIQNYDGDIVVICSSY